MYMYGPLCSPQAACTKPVTMPQNSLAVGGLLFLQASCFSSVLGVAVRTMSTPLAFGRLPKRVIGSRSTVVSPVFRKHLVQTCRTSTSWNQSSTLALPARQETMGAQVANTVRPRSPRWECHNYAAEQAFELNYTGPCSTPIDRAGSWQLARRSMVGGVMTRRPHRDNREPQTACVSFGAHRMSGCQWFLTVRTEKC